jgi:MFS family permease
MPALLFGRVLGGLSTTLLFTAFESWMVSEHRRQGFSEELLAGTFSVASAGNGIMAILAGLLAQRASG